MDGGAVMGQRWTQLVITLFWLATMTWLTVEKILPPLRPGEIVMQGVVEGSQLKLRVDAGDMSYNTERYMPRDALVGDELSPQARLPGLHAGQSWTVPVYNPLRPPDSPMEILQAKVEGHESLNWDGANVDTLLVVYRADSGSAYGASRAARGKMWVDGTGTVLRQEIDLLGSKLAFMRI